MTDSHCHLASPRFSQNEISQLIARARKNKVNRLITLATTPDDIIPNLELAQNHPEIHACLGIHPCDVDQSPDNFESLLTPHLDDHKVAAIGETGLDYFHPAPAGWSEDDYHARQRDFLHRHFQLAVKHSLNIVIHTRDRSGSASFDDSLEIYRHYHQDVRAVFHCFPGPHSLAKRIFELGGLISFTGIVTFKNATLVAESARLCPPDRFMVETDSPYLAPVPHRGQRNEPAYTLHSAEKIAELRQTSLQDIITHTENNVCSFFRIS